MRSKWSSSILYILFCCCAFQTATALDQWVLNSQEWVNLAYSNVPGYIRAPENGQTGWSTMFSLTRALQHELGLSEDALSNNFGPTTLSLITSKYGEIGSNSSKEVITIVQSALYCKGYSGDGLSGEYSNIMQDSVRRLRSNMGFTDSRATLSAKEMKALLTMDAYLLLPGGRSSARIVQQWFNKIYYPYPWFFIIPTDGYYSRDVQKALVYAIQTALDVSGANGNYGPGTRAAIKAIAPFNVGFSSTLVRLFQAAMIFNGYEVPFEDMYSALVAEKVGAFQSFVALPVTKTGDYGTWSSLLISTGDSDRKGVAADCVTEITPVKGRALYEAGYRMIGRYLTNVPNTSLNKKIQLGELNNIFASGLHVFPIYQTYGDEANYFNLAQGRIDARLAVEAAIGYGFKRETILYFAVDFDALDDDITSNVIPYFQGIQQEMTYYGYPYQVAIYAPRNVCSQLFALGLTVASFVADLSTGFSGNLGFPMPINWAFDQISTISIGSDLSIIEIDNNIASGRDQGQSSVLSRADILDITFNAAYKSELYADINAYESCVKSNTNLLLHSMNETLDVILGYDDFITSVSKVFGVRKALIQAEIFWEYWKQTPADIIADTAVLAYYVYKHNEENGIPPLSNPPVSSKSDSSTGIAQIFGGTAIRSRNWAVTHKLISDQYLNGTDWHVLEYVWNKLRNDDHYTIVTVILVLLEGASEMNITGVRTDYSEAELKKMFSRYNGFREEAIMYGSEVFGVYQIFEKYNLLSRL